MSEFTDKEEHYVLRVQDKTLAKNLRSILRDKKPEEPITEQLAIKFSNLSKEAREGVVIFDNETYPVLRQDLPTILESYKTYDNRNYVKVADIGQIIVVPEKDTDPPSSIESRHGFHLAMRDARRRRFRKPIEVDPNLMLHVEDAILQIAAGSAPEGYEFIDEEEEYVVSEDGIGYWVPITPASKPTTAVAQKKARRKESLDDAD